MHLSDWPRTVEEWWSQSWTPPANLNPWKWAEKHLELSSRSTAFPGKYSTALTPYVRTILEDFKDPSVRQIAMCFSAQAAKTQTLLTALAYSIDQDPGPVLLVQSSMDAARSFSRNRLQPLLEDAPVLARHKTDNRFDFTSAEMRLDNCSIYLQGAGNPAQLASRPIRFLFCDETDKWPDESDKEADSLSLAMERVKSYRNHKILLASTPTLATGPIWQAFKAGDQRRYHVPCPHCGTLFALQWQQVKWPESAALDVLTTETWLECPHCQGAITERHKAGMLDAGEWIPGNADAQEDRRSYHLSELYSPFTTWGSLAQKFVAASREAKQGSTGSLHNFINSSLAEPWEERHSVRAEDSILALRDDRPRGLVPGGGQVAALVATVDTQDNGFFYEIRAWGWGFAQDSWCVREGFIPADWRKVAPEDLQERSYKYHPAFDALRQVLFEDAYMDADGTQYPVQFALIDAMGHHTTDVYDFCRAHRGMIFPFKGEQKMATLYAWSDIDTYPGTSRKIPGGIKLLRANVTHFKNMLSDRLAIDPADPGAWRYHAETDHEWARMMCAEYKNEKTGKWECPSGRANHGWDCAVYHLVAAEVRGVKMWAKEVIEQQAAPAPQSAAVNPYTGGRQMFGSNA